MKGDPMMYSYSTTFADFKAAQRLFAQRSWKSKLNFLIWLRILPVSGLISAVLLIWDIGFRHFDFNPVFGVVLAGLAWFAFYIVLFRYFQLRKLYKRMKNGRPEGSPTEIGVEGDELVSRLPGLSEGRFKRPSVVGSIEDEKLMLLFVGKKIFFMLPKAALPEVALQEVRAWLQLPAESQS
jgi:hypothetical protein